VIDYGPVNFDHGKTSLWLPWYAELYLQVHGRRYHRHTLTNYALFSVDTDHQISAPKETHGGKLIGLTTGNSLQIASSIDAHRTDKNKTWWK
jgi:hypothetical protein